MAVSVSFNDKAITDKLDIYTKVQLPFIAVQTLNGLAKQVKKDLQHEMVDTFTYLSPFTYQSIRHAPASLRKIKDTGTDYAEVYHAGKSAVRRGGKQRGALKGNAAADYLEPLITGGPVYRTRFQRRLESKGILGPSFGRYMLPLHDAKGVRLSGQGRLANSEYVKALWGIRAMEDIRSSGQFGKQNYRTAGSYRWVPTNVDRVAPNYGKTLRVINRKASGQFRLPSEAGIYRVDNGGLTQVFKQLKTVPNVPKDYYLFSLTGEMSVKNNYERIFRQKVKEVIG